MKTIVSMLFPAFFLLFSGCGGSGNLELPFNAADSEARHALFADGRGRVSITPAVDHGQLVHIVRGGNAASVSISEISRIRLYYKPDWKKSEVAFSEGEVDMIGAPRRGEGTFSFITRSGEELWTNLDYVLCNGAPCQRTKDDLVTW